MKVKVVLAFVVTCLGFVVVFIGASGCGHSGSGSSSNAYGSAISY